MIAKAYVGGGLAYEAPAPLFQYSLSKKKQWKENDAVNIMLHHLYLTLRGEYMKISSIGWIAIQLAHSRIRIINLISPRLNKNCSLGFLCIILIKVVTLLMAKFSSMTYSVIVGIEWWHTRQGMFKQ